MATSPYDNYSADIYSSASMPGGGLSYYTSAAPPYGSVNASRPRSAGGGNSDLSKDMLMAGLTGGVSSLVDIAKGKLPFQSLFGGNDKPRTPYWQRLANKEWAQANAALSTQYQMYEPMLRLTQRSAADYGDLWRRAANDQLAFDLRSATTKRRGDLADFQNLSGDYVAQLRASNPMLASYYDTAQSNMALGSSLSPQQQAELENAVRQGQAARGMGLGPADVYEEALNKTTYGENLRRQRMAEARDALGLYGDIFQATTGRPTMTPEPRGINVNAPETGIGINDYLSMGLNFQQQDRNDAAAKQAQKMALIGAGINAVGNLGGMAMGGLCWLAREVYGEASPRWKQFRRWLITQAPAKLLAEYAEHGADAAEYLRAHPEHKPAVRAWMDGKLEAMAA